MSKQIVGFKKMVLVALILGLGMVFLPLATASAADVDPARLELAYDRLGDWYTYQSTWMGNAESNIARVQNLINKATGRGYDASAVQAALDAFAAAYPNARVFNEQAAAILATHAGFDDAGKVTDATQALETVRSLHAALKSAHDAMNGTGQALKDAIRAFREANQPPAQP